MSHWSQCDDVPPLIHVSCPSCSGRAEFWQAVPILFRTNSQYREAALLSCFLCHSWNTARGFGSAEGWYFPELDSLSGDEWSPETRRHFGLNKLGTLRCTTCCLKHKRRLCWPEDAYYQCEVRGDRLWAWSEEHAQMLRDFIQCKRRLKPAQEIENQPFLKVIPTKFLVAKNRKSVLQQLNRLLG